MLDAVHGTCEKRAMISGAVLMTRMGRLYTRIRATATNTKTRLEPAIALSQTLKTPGTTAYPPGHPNIKQP